MKRISLLLTLFVSLFLIAAVSVALPTLATDNVTVSGNDLLSALNSATDGSTITVNGTCTVPAGFTWPSYDRSVTITGGTLDLTAMGTTVSFNGNVTFESITLTMAPDATVYANGHKLTVKESVTVTNAVTAIYGGGKSGTTVASTDLTLLAGDYKSIYGGSNGGTVSGDTHVLVGGTVNTACDWTSHTATYSVYGGGNADTVKGDTHMTFTGNAKANYIWGGSVGAATIKGDKYATMSGGSTMSFYGGNKNRDTGAGSTNYTEMTGGQLQQLFGGNQGASMTGDIYLRVLGGTVTRRVYGGCYNNFEAGGILEILSGNLGKWSSTYQVTGNIVVTIGNQCNISYTFTDGLTTADKGLFAGSRLSSYKNTGAVPANENTTLIFLDTYQSAKLGAQDGTMKSVMSGISVADEIHTVTHTVNGTTLTQTCDGSGHDKDGSSATAAGTAHTATLMLSASASAFPYTGNAVTPVTATYSTGWLGQAAPLTYTGNVNVGEATASVTCNGVTVTLPFTITKAPSSQGKPAVIAIAETKRGKADGMITPLSIGMEWSADGETYHSVSMTNPPKFAPGTYYVRYAAVDENHEPSLATTVTVHAGAPIVITFKANGQTVATRELDWNATLTDLPEVPAKEGYIGTWKNADLENVTENMTVEARYTVKSYTITFQANGITVATQKVNHGASLTTLPAVPAKAGYTGVWDTTDFNTVTGDMTVNAVYTAKTYTVIFKIDGETVATETVTHGTAVTAPTLPQKEGHTVTWSVADLSAVTGDLVVEAVYTPITCTITFVAEGVVVASKTINKGESLTGIPQVPVKVGYSGAWETTDFDTVTEDMTVNAVYTALPPVITPEEELPEEEPEESGKTDEENANAGKDQDGIADSGSPVLVIVLIAVGALIVIGGAAAVIVIKKKKKA